MSINCGHADIGASFADCLIYMLLARLGADGDCVCFHAKIILFALEVAMDEKLAQQLIGEMVRATGDAIGLVMAAVVCQLDPHRLRIDLVGQLNAARAAGHPSLAIGLATNALAAVDAEILLRQHDQDTQQH
jgi:hypothetical protein